MARGEQVLRQWKILTCIMCAPRYGITQKKLLDAIGDVVSKGTGKRTLQRDLQVLESVGFHLDRSARTEAGEVLYKLDESVLKIPPILATQEELFALGMARSLVSQYEGTPFKENLDSFWQKIQAVFPKASRECLEESMEMFGTIDRPVIDYKKYKALVGRLNHAIKKRQQLLMVYFSQRQGKEAEYTIDPIRLITHKGVLFLAAYVYQYKNVRHFSLSKIKRILPTGMIFPHRSYSLQALKKEAFGLIWEEPFKLKVRFNKEFADHIKQTEFHPSQEIKDFPNGDVLITMTAGGWDEIKAWVQGYAHQAEVLAPLTMREEIKRDLERSLAHYQVDPAC